MKEGGLIDSIQFVKMILLENSSEIYLYYT